MAPQKRWDKPQDFPPYINFISVAKRGTTDVETQYSSYQGSAFKKASEMAEKHMPLNIGVFEIDRKLNRFTLIKEFRKG